MHQVSSMVLLLMDVHIHQRKKRVPKPAAPVTLPEPIQPVALPKPDEPLKPHHQRRKELFDLHGAKIPLADIFVDRGNGVVLYRNPETNGWLYGGKDMDANQSINQWLRYSGFAWVDGEERMYKSLYTWVEARELIEQLKAEGVVVSDR